MYLRYWFTNFPILVGFQSLVDFKMADVIRVVRMSSLEQSPVPVHRDSDSSQMGKPAMVRTRQMIRMIDWEKLLLVHANSDWVYHDQVFTHLLAVHVQAIPPIRLYYKPSISCFIYSNSCSSLIPPTLHSNSPPPLFILTPSILHSNSSQSSLQLLPIFTLTPPTLHSNSSYPPF